MEKKYINRIHFYDLLANLLTKETGYYYKKNIKEEKNFYGWGVKSQYGNTIIFEHIKFEDCKWLELELAIEKVTIYEKEYKSFEILKSTFLKKLLKLNIFHINITREMEFKLVEDIFNIISLDESKKETEFSIQKIVNSYKYQELASKYIEVLGYLDINNFYNLSFNRETIFLFLKIYLERKYKKTFTCEYKIKEEIMKKYYDYNCDEDKVIIVEEHIYNILDEHKRVIISETIADNVYLDRPIDTIREDNNANIEENSLNLNDSTFITGARLYNLIADNFSLEPNLIILLYILKDVKNDFDFRNANELINFLINFNINNTNNIEELKKFNININNKKNKVILFLKKDINV